MCLNICSSCQRQYKRSAFAVASSGQLTALIHTYPSPPTTFHHQKWGGLGILLCKKKIWRLLLKGYFHHFTPRLMLLKPNQTKPYYWNLKPNSDFRIRAEEGVPEVLSFRGSKVENEHIFASWPPSSDKGISDHSKWTLTFKNFKTIVSL